MSDWRPSIQPIDLIERSRLIRRVRQFFDERGVLEVDTPAVSTFPAADSHIDPPTVQFSTSLNDRHFLISSPEYHMKRLLSAGSGSIYQVCKAFRVDEVGQFHNPEFTMLEWYRVGWDHWRLMTEIEELTREVFGLGKADKIAYKDLFIRQFQFDYRELNYDRLTRICQEERIPLPESMTPDCLVRDEALDFLMGMVIEPTLGRKTPIFVHGFPASQASLSKLLPEDPEHSTRFELYYRGVELGNGFHELTDSAEQRQRFEAENRKRESAGKQPLPIDHRFLKALDNGLPECAGVAVGIDRLIMLALDKPSIDHVISFGWERK